MPLRRNRELEKKSGTCLKSRKNRTLEKRRKKPSTLISIYCCISVIWNKSSRIKIPHFQSPSTKANVFSLNITWDCASLARISSGWQLAWVSVTFQALYSVVLVLSAVMCWVLNLLNVPLFLLFKSWGMAIPLCTLLGFHSEKHMCITSISATIHRGQHKSTVGRHCSFGSRFDRQTTNHYLYSRRVGIRDITGIPDICVIYHPEDICVWRTNCLKHWKDWFPWGSMSNSAFNLDETKTFYLFTTCSRVFQSKIWTKTS